MQDLPTEVLALIFRHLDARDVEHAAQVCRRWYHAATDAHLWGVLGDSAEHYALSLCSCSIHRAKQETHLLAKRRFIEHVPDRGRGLMCARRTTESPFTLLRRLGRQPAPWTVVLFGSGLEVPGSGLVSRLMWGDKTSPFTTLRAFPGGAMGIGGGVQLAFKSHLLNLITLYRHNKTAREERTADGFPVVLTNHTIDTAAARVATLAVCERADAIVYAYDAHLPIRDEVIRDFHTLVPIASDRPILVLHLVTNLNAPRVTCRELMEGLELHTRSSRWWIITVDGFSFSQLERGFEWLLPKPWWS